MSDQSVFGPIPPEAVCFKVQRRSATKPEGHKGFSWETLLGPANDGSGANVPNFPIDALTLDGIRETFGQGTYRLDFFRDIGENKLKHLRFSHTFELAAERTVRNSGLRSPTPSPAPPPPPVTLHSDPMLPLQMAQLLAREQIAAMALMQTQQIAFVQSHAQASQEMMSQHYAAMLKASNASDGPVIRALERMEDRLRSLEEYDNTPDPSAVTPPPAAEPLTGLHVFLKAVEKVPDALEMVKLWAETQKAKPNGQAPTPAIAQQAAE